MVITQRSVIKPVTLSFLLVIQGFTVIWWPASQTKACWIDGKKPWTQHWILLELWRSTEKGEGFYVEDFSSGGHQKLIYGCQLEDNTKQVQSCYQNGSNLSGQGQGDACGCPLVPGIRILEMGLMGLKGSGGASVLSMHSMNAQKGTLETRSKRCAPFNVPWAIPEWYLWSGGAHCIVCCGQFHRWKKQYQEGV